MLVNLQLKLLFKRKTVYHYCLFVFSLPCHLGPTHQIESPLVNGSHRYQVHITALATVLGCEGYQRGSLHSSQNKSASQTFLPPRILMRLICLHFQGRRNSLSHKARYVYTPGNVKLKKTQCAGEKIHKFHWACWTATVG